MEQISRRPDEMSITSQGSTNEFVYGLINNKQVNRPYNSLQIMKNFDITTNGSLITRPGLFAEIDMKDFIEFDKLLGYRNTLTQVYKKTSTKIGWVNISNKSYTEVSENTLLFNINLYKYIIVNLTINGNNENLFIDTYQGNNNIYYQSGSDYVLFSIKDNSLSIHEISGTTLNSLEVVSSSEDDSTLKNDTSARGIIEVATVLQGSVVNMYTRYSKLSLTTDDLISVGDWYLAGKISDVGTDYLENFYTNKRLFIINSSSELYVKTPDGLYKLNYFNDAGVIKLKMDNLMDKESEDRYKPSTSEVTVNGYNILAEFPEEEIVDNVGVINSLDGIIVQGVDVTNRTQPFKVHKQLLIRALVTYVRETDLEDMKFKFSYDYMGGRFTESPGFNKKEGEFPISDGYGSQAVPFEPKQVGMYRIYCQMSMPNEAGEYEDSENIVRHVAIDIQVEIDNQTEDDLEELFLYNAFKQSRIIRQFREYYVVCGASFTTPYSSKVFISAPNNPSYFPTNYTYTLPDGIFVTDVVEYSDYLVILTNKGVYYLEGDVPYSVAQLATDKSLKSFVLNKIVENLSAYYTDNIVSTKDGVLLVSDNIYKLFGEKSSLTSVKTIGDPIIDMLPNDGFNFVQQIGDKTYFTNEDEILVYETLDYNTTGLSGRFSFYHMHGLIVKDIFVELNKTFFVLETGEVCLLDKSRRGYDLTHPFTAEFKTNTNYFGNRNYPKKFKRLFYDILPLLPIGDQQINYEENYDYEKPKEKECWDNGEYDIIIPEYLPEKGCVNTLKFSLDLYLDNEHHINSMYIETVEQLGGGWKVYRIHSPNMVVNTDMYQMTKKDEFLAYGKNELYEIYGRDMIDWEQLDQAPYLAQVRLRGRGSHKSTSCMMRFDDPVMINSLGYDFKNRSTKGDYAGNKMKHYKRIRR